MGVSVFLPLVLPLTAWPVARLAEHHLPPGAATWLLSAVAAVLAVCSTLCLGLLMVVGTARLPGNPLPGRRDRIVVTTGMPAGLDAGERRTRRRRRPWGAGGPWHGRPASRR